MIQIFKGRNPHYQQQYDDIKQILQKEHCLELPEPSDLDIYIYWSNPDYFARGGVCLTLGNINNQPQYILSNIAFHIDFELYEREFENDEEGEIVEQMGVSFYQAIYNKLYDSVNQQTLQLSSSNNKIKSFNQHLSSDIQAQTIHFPTLSSEQLHMQLFHEELSDCITYGCWPSDEGKIYNDYYHHTILSLSNQDRLNCLQQLKKFKLSFDK